MRRNKYELQDLESCLLFVLFNYDATDFELKKFSYLIIILLNKIEYEEKKNKDFLKKNEGSNFMTSGLSNKEGINKNPTNNYTSINQLIMHLIYINFYDSSSEGHYDIEQECKIFSPRDEMYLTNNMFMLLYHEYYLVKAKKSLITKLKKKRLKTFEENLLGKYDEEFVKYVYEFSNAIFKCGK